MDDTEKRNEYARRYRERNRELLRQKERERRERMPPRPGRQIRPLVDRFWEKVDKRGPDECWEWQGALDHGYGSIGLGSRKQGTARASRVSWEIHNPARIPEGLHVLHTCDNPPCVNPAHLYLGTDVENARDRVERGRAKGPSGPIVRAPGWNRKVREDDRRGYANRKFSDEQEQEIAARFAAGGVTKKALAKEYGVSQPTIKAIIDRAITAAY